MSFCARFKFLVFILLVFSITNTPRPVGHPSQGGLFIPLLRGVPKRSVGGLCFTLSRNIIIPKKNKT